MKKIAIVGGGPAALFMLKRLVEAAEKINVSIYERSNYLGAGMPYSTDGACDEHITNVSPNEIPELVSGVAEWLETASPDTKKHFNITPATLNEYKVLPRLFFGHYLHSQFESLLKQAKKNGIETHIHLATEIVDIVDNAAAEKTTVVSKNGRQEEFDHVVICSGHHWPKKEEGNIPGYFNSPYPPSKLAVNTNHAVAIRGSSLTAIDAIRTLSRHNGYFSESKDGMLTYTRFEESKQFTITMYSLGGLLPALRFHLEDPQLQKNAVLSDEVIAMNRSQNGGFLSLDFVFEKNFKDLFIDVNPVLYAQIREMSMEEFVSHAMRLRNELDAVTLFKAEYKEAEKSIRRRESVHWKELLAVLSFAMNYPAKYFSAEDMLRLQQVLKPLISIVIAFIPQSSAKELIALFDAGVLDIVSVDKDSEINAGESGGAVVTYRDGDHVKSVAYPFFVDCIGQPQLEYRHLPFKSLVHNSTVTPARIQFRSAIAGQELYEKQPEQVEKTAAGDYYLKVPGIAINDNFQVLDTYNAASPRIFMMAVPFIGGFNPDYSGLDFCEAASAKIIERLLHSSN